MNHLPYKVVLKNNGETVSVVATFEYREYADLFVQAIFKERNLLDWELKDNGLYRESLDGTVHETITIRED